MKIKTLLLCLLTAQISLQSGNVGAGCLEAYKAEGYVYKYDKKELAKTCTAVIAMGMGLGVIEYAFMAFGYDGSDPLFPPSGEAFAGVVGAGTALGIGGCGLGISEYVKFSRTLAVRMLIEESLVQLGGAHPVPDPQLKEELSFPEDVSFVEGREIEKKNAEIKKYNSQLSELTVLVAKYKKESAKTFAKATKELNISPDELAQQIVALDDSKALCDGTIMAAEGKKMMDKHHKPINQLASYPQLMDFLSNK